MIISIEDRSGNSIISPSRSSEINFLSMRQENERFASSSDKERAKLLVEGTPVLYSGTSITSLLSSEESRNLGGSLISINDIVELNEWLWSEVPSASFTSILTGQLLVLKVS